MSDAKTFKKADVAAFLQKLGLQKPELKHYGTKGMKWGIRKDRTASSGGQDAPRKKRTPPTTKVPNTFKNTPENRRMSDAELRNRLNRLQMEKQYKELTAPSKATKSFVRNLMEDSGKRAAKTLATRATDVALQLALEKLAGTSKGQNKVFFEAMAAAGKGKKKD